MSETAMEAAAREYAARWQTTMAPRTGDILRELTLEAAEYLGITPGEADRMREWAPEGFMEEWRRVVSDPEDPELLVRFYNESKAELFEQIIWHAGEPIHHRSFVCAELASRRPGREFLDYGSGIGSNAIIFGLAGFNITLADIADPLLGFAKWRCEKRGLQVRTIDLKRQSLERERYDVITCFDVLEHVPKPLRAVKRMRDALRPGGLFFLYAPFGYDPDRPMHIVHDASVFRHMRSLGFLPKEDWERAFPSHVRAHHIYERVARSTFEKLAYRVRDTWATGPLGDAVAKVFRAVAAGHHPREQSGSV
jgi:2-polyprenyl-3-methyl-5-hydroxy-6-metoxy-1,4-benzoquinol methylase